MNEGFKYSRRLLALLALAAGLCGCQRRETAEAAWQFRTIGQEGWYADDTLVFDVDSIAAAGYYEAALCLRTSAAEACPYTDISLLVTSRWETDSVVVTRRDTLECLFTTERGDVKGAGVSLYQYNLPFDTLHLSAGNRGRIVVEHIMRRSPLPGIHDVGIKVRNLSAQDYFSRWRL